ncbi:hypothetical protein U9M48_030869 [Paspalum notatum var. saurae]|uniref:Uncharacterized protein n=1 Tax=Paspalum notatum var. saurae TaxID=547442 RepID=A0AAQ3U2H1_PASNO
MQPTISRPNKSRSTAASALQRPRYSVPRVMVKRKIRETWMRLSEHYFDPQKVYPDAYFRRMYRVSPRLFRRIADAVTAFDDYFEEKENKAGKTGANPYQKILACFKMLATGLPPLALEFEFGISKAVADNRGFPGMIGSIDCMHWEWEKCPVAWGGDHRGHTHKPTIILEAVAGPNLWIWHAFFGLPGSLNDVNVLHRSHVFDNLAAGKAPTVSFSVNGNAYDMGYYLADGIYPDWATLVKGVARPTNVKEKLFTTKQSAYRKDVERAFGVLQAKFKILRGPARSFFMNKMKYNMECCVIVHNMAVEDERGQPVAGVHDFHHGTEPQFLPRQQLDAAEMIQNHKKIQSRVVHSKLQADLMDHLIP